ncbi:ABC transporter substrate-binding protein [Haladaptatus sp. DJG-WS-42]|uniref:ABC transporter substrate-binding protein n=1 Tax=Haladaptatus sp. DJG-WS-42 TaxID=3120516 RepID=UPI0030CDDD75
MTKDEYSSQRRRFLKTIGGAATVSMVAGCLGDNEGADGTTTTSGAGGDETTTSGGGNGGGSSGDALKVGVYGPFSGPASNIGDALKKGAQLAAKEINASDSDTQLELYFGDSESEPAKGRSAVEFLIDEEGVDMIAGGFHSDVSLAVVEVTAAKGVPQMISNSVSAAINEKIESQDMRNVFKMSPPSEAYGLGWQQFLDGMQEAGDGYFPFDNKRIAMIGETTSYGTSVMDATASYLEEGGWNVVSQDEVAVDETNFTSLLTRIRSNDPDIVWAVQTAPSAGANLIKQFRQTGFDQTHFMHTFVPSNPETINLAGDAANGVLWMTNIGAIPKLTKEIGLADAWQSEYGGAVPGSSGSLSYDNLKIVDKVMAEIGGKANLSVETWEQAVIDLDPHTGSAGMFDWTEDGPFHQALWGKDTVPALASQIVDQQNNVVWPFELSDTEIDNSLYE